MLNFFKFAVDPAACGKQQKKKKVMSQHQLKKQKKKDKLAHFPISNVRNTFNDGVPVVPGSESSVILGGQEERAM